MKNSIAIIALVQNTSAIQLKDQFVNLTQVRGDPMDELGGMMGGGVSELGILGDTGGMPSELGFGAPATSTNSEMDELGLGPPKQPEGASMKNVITGAPPAGFADFMRLKAEKAAAMKN